MRRTMAPALSYFYSRPCGRGDAAVMAPAVPPVGFLLTPLREGRHHRRAQAQGAGHDFYSRPCGRGDAQSIRQQPARSNFYSRPCGRGDPVAFFEVCIPFNFYSRPCGRGDTGSSACRTKRYISTHAPAGGATGGGLSLSARTAQPFLLTPLREGRPSTCES